MIRICDIVFVKVYVKNTHLLNLSKIPFLYNFNDLLISLHDTIIILFITWNQYTLD